MTSKFSHLIFAIVTLTCSPSLASSLRSIDADTIKSSDHAHTFTLPTVSITIPNTIVSSAALTMPAIFSVSGSPITSSGTFAVTLATENANKVWAGPTTGADATPTFRTLVAADLPSGLLALSVERWYEGANAPDVGLDAAGYQDYIWTSAAAQILNTVVTVSGAYTSGSQIKLRMKFYSPNFSSGTDLMTTVATLNRTGTDAITSTTNQRTSTNTAVTPAGANIPYLVSFDLTDSTGKINGVSVSAGDTILVSLTRGTDTDTGVVHGIMTGEATFQ